MSILEIRKQVLGKRCGPCSPASQAALSCSVKLRLCLAIASVSVLLGGCMGPGADFKKEKTDTQQPASYDQQPKEPL